MMYNSVVDAEVCSCVSFCRHLMNALTPGSNLPITVSEAAVAFLNPVPV